MPRVPTIYILASRSRNLYTGVTNNLESRVLQHRQGLTPGFTTRYKIFLLVHFETFSTMSAAIAREKQLKHWHRKQKIALIERHNPTWQDFAAHLPPSTNRTSTNKHPASQLHPHVPVIPKPQPHRGFGILLHRMPSAMNLLLLVPAPTASSQATQLTMRSSTPTMKWCPTLALGPGCTNHHQGAV